MPLNERILWLMKKIKKDFPEAVIIESDTLAKILYDKMEPRIFWALDRYFHSVVKYERLKKNEKTKIWFLQLADGSYFNKYHTSSCSSQ